MMTFFSNCVRKLMTSQALYTYQIKRSWSFSGIKQRKQLMLSAAFSFYKHHQVILYCCHNHFYYHKLTLDNDRKWPWPCSQGNCTSAFQNSIFYPLLMWIFDQLLWLKHILFMTEHDKDQTEKKSYVLSSPQWPLTLYDYWHYFVIRQGK